MLLEDYEIYHYRDESEPHVSLHFHDFYECYLLLSGELSYQIESASFALLPGDLLLIGPNQLHRPLFSSKNEAYDRIVLWLSRAFVARLSSDSTDLSACFSATRNSVIRLPEETRAQLTDMLFRLLSAGEVDDFGKDVLCRSLVTSLLVSLNRVSGSAKKSLPKSDVRVSRLVKLVSAYLDEHLGEAVTLDELSHAVFLSKYYLERQFKKETGVSIYRMFLQKRMIRARNLMREGMSLTQVSLACGFSEYSGFYKAFRSEYGMSPHAYLAVSGSIARI
jgi:AraC-like DNA-binding protein